MLVTTKHLKEGEMNIQVAGANEMKETILLPRNMNGLNGRLPKANYTYSVFIFN